MSFENQLSDIFNLDIWELKPQYKQLNDSQTHNDDHQKSLKTIIDTKQELVNTKELIYTNKIDSNKVINLYLENKLNINFLKNIISNLFFNSKVNIYKAQSLDFQNDENVINLFEKDFTTNSNNLLSAKNKKDILSNLYKYADFKTR